MLTIFMVYSKYIKQDVTLCHLKHLHVTCMSVCVCVCVCVYECVCVCVCVCVCMHGCGKILIACVHVWYNIVLCSYVGIEMYNLVSIHNLPSMELLMVLYYRTTPIEMVGLM